MSEDSKDANSRNQVTKTMITRSTLLAADQPIITESRLPVISLMLMTRHILFHDIHCEVMEVATIVSEVQPDVVGIHQGVESCPESPQGSQHQGRTVSDSVYARFAVGRLSCPTRSSHSSRGLPPPFSRSTGSTNLVSFLPSAI